MAFTVLDKDMTNFLCCETENILKRASFQSREHMYYNVKDWKHCQ